MVIMALGALAMHVINGGTRQNPWRKHAAITHGIGMFLSLLGGFGLLARLGISQGGLPGWIWAKLVIWTILGGLIAVILRKPLLAKSIWYSVILFAGLGAYLANYKPF